MNSEIILSQEASQYKSIIREQDSKIKTLCEQLRQSEINNAGLMVNINVFLFSDPDIFENKFRKENLQRIETHSN